MASQRRCYNLNERLKAARKAMHLSQGEFGARIGVTTAAISKLERGQNKLTDQVVISVCREFGIGETWLRTGDGEMFIETENAILSSLTAEYGLDELDQKILKIYVSLPKSHRDIIKDFAQRLADAARTGASEDAHGSSARAQADAPEAEGVSQEPT
jgi:transcriptional regulator with XRE-family HTH domain